MAAIKFKATNLTDAARQVRKQLQERMGDIYKPRDRETNTAVSYITVYRHRKNRTEYQSVLHPFAPCHGGHLNVPDDNMRDRDTFFKVWERSFNVSLPAIQKWDDDNMDAYTMWFDYILNRAPFSHVYRTKKATLFIEQGAVMNGGEEDITMCHFALVSGRTPREYADVPLVFRKLVELGLNEHTAFAMACFTRFTTAKKDMLSTCPRGHMMLYPAHCNFTNYLKWNRPNKGAAPYQTATSYMGVDAQFGETSVKSSYGSFIKPFATETVIKDAWGGNDVNSVVKLTAANITAIEAAAQAVMAKK